MQQKATLLMATRLPFKFPCLAGNLTATWAKCRPWNLIRLHTALISLRHTYSTPPFLSYLLSLKTRQVIQGMACNCNTSILSTLSPSQHSPWAGELKSAVDTAAGPLSIWDLSCGQDVFSLYAKQAGSWNSAEMLQHNNKEELQAQRSFFFFFSDL